MKTKSINICIVCKNDEKYLKHWIDYHKNLGVNKIYFCDNNEIGDNNQFNIVKEYTTNDFLQYIDVKGIVDRPKFVAYEKVNEFITGRLWLISF